MLRRGIRSRAALYGLIAIVAAPLVLAIALRFGTPISASVPPSPTPPPVSNPSPVPAPVPTALPAPVPTATPMPLATRRVGIQPGHWLDDYLPDELSTLPGTGGVQGDGWEEIPVNLQVARLIGDILSGEGVQVDLLPATVPEGYDADLFLSLHADAWKDHSWSGFKVARSEWSQVPDMDDALVRDLIVDFEAETGLPEHRNTVSDNMTEYYAFNYEEYSHAISPSTSGAVIEMGFLTNDGDRELLTQQPDRAARGIAEAVLSFLRRRAGVAPHGGGR